jgi:hypothetical protein
MEVNVTKPFGYLKQEPILLSGNLPICSKAENLVEYQKVGSVLGISDGQTPAVLVSEVVRNQ